MTRGLSGIGKDDEDEIYDGNDDNAMASLPSSLPATGRHFFVSRALWQKRAVSKSRAPWQVQ